MIVWLGETLVGSSFAGETLDQLTRELNKLVDSSKVSVVTVVSKFSDEIYVEKERAIFSIFKSEREKHSISYVNVGTGLIIDEDGYVVTRSSIVLNSVSNHVTLANGKKIKADFVGHDPETGFAIIKIQQPNEQRNLVPARLENTEKVDPGSWIVMIGNSVGVFPAVGFGAIHGLRSDGLIQISGNLNPGNNGSPLIDFHGKVVGMVAGRLSAQQNVTGSLNNDVYDETILAYPINWIKRIVDDIIRFGYVRKGWLGVVGYYDGWKPKIREIKENSPAKQAGLTEGDVIINFSNKDINSISQLVHLVEYSSPGEVVSIKFMREDKILKTNVKIGEKSRTKYSDTLQKEHSIVSQKSPSPELQRFPLDLFERNQLLEKRIDHLEREIEKLKEMIESN